MKPWMEPFIRPCLARIPDRLYRKRLTAELADHLESLSADLKAEGLSVQQAQALALERMGNPEELSRQPYGRWRQHVRSPRYVLGQLALACWMMGLVFLLAFFLLGVAGFTYDAAPGWSMQGNPAVTAAAGGTIFLIPFSFGAFWLARQFQGHPHPRALVFAGLLLAWLGQLCVLLLLSSLLYDIPLGQPARLLARISGGGDPLAPWFTPVYLSLTLVGCGLLSLLPPSLRRQHGLSR